MKILITGSTGLLGRSLIKILSKEHKIYAIIRNGSDTSVFREFQNITYIRTDLSFLNIDVLPSDIDAIYYLAQSHKFREFPDGAQDVFEININSPFKIINWALKSGVKKFFYTSSGGVYKSPTRPIKEFFDINANEKNGFYLDSKLSTELLLRNYSIYFDCFSIIRPFFIYGPYQGERMLIPRLIKNILTGVPIILNGDVGIRLNPIFVDDAAYAFANLINLEGEFIVNIAGDEIISLKALSILIGKIVGVSPNFEHSNIPKYDIIADNVLMKEKLYEPKMNLREGIALTYKSS